MPEEDKAKSLTPADLRRRRGSATLVLGLFMVAVTGAFAATILAVNDGRNYRRLVRELGLEDYLLSVPADLRVDKPKLLAPTGHYPRWLISPLLERNAVFENIQPISAAKRCDKLKAEKGTKPEFNTAGNNWECIVFLEFGNSAELGSLFIQAKGVLPDEIRSFRIKLSLLAPAQEIVIIKEAVAAIERFGLSLTPETRTYVREMLDTRREFSSIVENYRMTFAQEMTDARRYNLLILPRPQMITCREMPPLASRNAVTYRVQISCLPLRGAPFQQSGS